MGQGQQRLAIFSMVAAVQNLDQIKKHMAVIRLWLVSLVATVVGLTVSTITVSPLVSLVTPLLTALLAAMLTCVWSGQAPEWLTSLLGYIGGATLFPDAQVRTTFIVVFVVAAVLGHLSE